MLRDDPAALRRALDLLPTAGMAPIGALEAVEPKAVPVRIGAFELRSVLGEGGFGIVWLATQSKPLERSVALKVLRPDRVDPSSRARFDMERRLLALLDHPSLVKVFDAGETDDGRPWFTMELAQGAPITDAADAARLGIDERLRLAAQIARAVHHAHTHGLVHRDLKPSNILLSIDGDQLQVKVIDFGVAHAVFEPTDPDQRAGALVGTPDYLAPELARLHTVAPDVRTDVFAMGVVLRRLLSGNDPSDRRASASASLQLLDAAHQRRIAQDRGESVSSLRYRLEGDIDAIVTRCVADDPRLRYATALELAQDIDHHLAGQAVNARGDSFAYRSIVAARQNRRSIAVGALIAMVASIGIGWALHEQTLALIARDEAELSARRLQQTNAYVLDLLMEITSAPDMKPRAASDLLQEASRLAGLRLASDQVQEARVRLAIGRLFKQLKQHEQASKEFQRVSQLTGAQSVAHEFESLHLDHADSLRALGQTAEALQKLDAAQQGALTQVPEDHDDLAAVLLLRAEIACARQDQAEATALATQLRDALRQAPIERPDLVERLNALAPCIQK
jgi:eukaryotic-like serine/threonine-protein kinase